MWTAASAPGRLDPGSIRQWASDQFRDLSAALAKIGRRNPYQPIWTGSATPPSLGNGTLSGAFVEVGQLIIASGRLLVGSTSTFGTGDWRFSLPRAVVKDVPNAMGVAMFNDVSANVFDIGVTYVVAGAAEVLLFPHGVSGISATLPFTWAVGDQLWYDVAYPIE